MQAPGRRRLCFGAVPTDKRQRQKEGQRARREAALAATRRRQRRSRLILFVVFALVIGVILALVAAGGGDDKKKDEATSPTTMPKPKVTLPKDREPTELVKKDLKVGKGTVAKLGDNIEVNYLLVQLSNGKEFDSTWKQGQTATFPLNEGGLIDGWTKGIPGMRVGGRRELIVPASMAYGETNPRAGGPSGALLFIIDLVAIK